MKIINTEHNEAYQLSPGTQLDFERTNLFFNEYGEHSVPLNLPPTPLNSRLAGYADDMAKATKAKDVMCTVSDGAFYAQARQSFLSGKRKSEISSSFYLNEGSFLSKLAAVKVTDVFGTETIPGITTVDEGIEFCRSLLSNEHPQYAIAPYFVDLDSERRMVNQLNYYDASGNYASGGTIDFYNAWARSETVDDATIALSPGYYMTPFIRAYFVLERVLQYFGYELEENFFGTTTPFKEMVFIPTTTDTLVNGDIRIAHLVPDCYCNTLLDLFRKKFCCEFIPDEIAGKIAIKFFRDTIQGAPSHDLSSVATSEPSIEYPEYKQLKLASSSNVGDADLFDSTAEILMKYPEAYVDAQGRYVRTGYTQSSVVTQVVGAENQPYSIEGDLEEYDVEVPDCSFSMVTLGDFAQTSGRNNLLTRTTRIPYIGDGQTLNSTLVVGSSDEESTDSNDTKAKTTEQMPILSFVYFNKISWLTNHTGEGAWDYSLLYSGQHGIFEKFYRDFDNLLRNSLHPVKVDLLLSPTQKMEINAQDKIVINGQHLLINKLCYTIGGTNKPVQSELLTTRLYHPVQNAPAEADRFKQNTTYKWKINKTETSITQAEFLAYPVQVEASSRVEPLPAIYPLSPTPEIYAAGGQYYHRSYASHMVGRDGKDYYTKIEWALSPILFSESSTDGRS